METSFEFNILNYMILWDAIPLHSSVSRLPIINGGVGFRTDFGIKLQKHYVGCCGDYVRNCTSGYTVQISRDFVVTLKSQTKSYAIIPPNMAKIKW
jgi:hypothetical protein